MLGIVAAPGGFAQAATPRSSPGAIENVPYGSQEAQEMNIFPASRNGTASATTGSGSPVVVLVHGGGWRKQTVYTLREFAKEARTLQAAGLTVFEIDYRQDSRETAAFPLETGDVTTAINWVLAHAASYGGDTNQLILVGGSAGGQLVAAVAEQLAAQRPGTVKGVVSLSGPFNFPQLRADFRNRTVTNESFKDSVRQALHWWGGQGAFPQAFAEEWSPALHAPHSACPPWLMFNSEDELIPLAQAREMQANLAAAGCSAQLTVIPGTAHAFEYWPQVERQIISFAAEH